MEVVIVLIWLAMIAGFRTLQSRYEAVDTQNVLLMVSDFFDFDVLEIGSCSLDDINDFCIKAGNDPSMVQCIHDIPIRILPGVEIEDHALRNLEKVFSTKKSRETFRL